MRRFPRTLAPLPLAVALAVAGCRTGPEPARPPNVAPADMALPVADLAQPSPFLAVPYEVTLDVEDACGTFLDVAAGDFDRDGRLDLAGFVPSLKDVFTGFCHGRGDGGFDRLASFAAVGFGEPALTSSRALDLDGDGGAELVYGAIAFSGAAPQGGTLTIASARWTSVDPIPSATLFTLPVDGTIQSQQPPLLDAADFDRDGHLDLVVSAFDGLAASTTRLLLGNGDGTVRDGGPLGNLHELVAGDFDGDGLPDLVGAANDDTCTLELLRGHGDGSFAAPTPLGFPVTSSCQPVVVTDVDADGLPDLLAITRQPSPTVADAHLTVLRGLGNGVFKTINIQSFSVPLPPPGTEVGPQPVPLVAADFDRDGLPDLAIDVNGHTQVLRGDGAGHFGPAWPLPSLFDDLSDDAAPPLLVGDFDGDGRLDLALRYALMLNRIGD